MKTRLLALLPILLAFVIATLLSACHKVHALLSSEGGDSATVKVDSLPDNPGGSGPGDSLTGTAGTPGNLLDPDLARACFEAPPGERLGRIEEEEGAINVYFNKSARTDIEGAAGNEASHNVNLERRLVHRLRGARKSIDFATYEINLPRIVQALVDKAAEGVKVRVLADGKAPDDEEREVRYDAMRALLERLARGRDGKPGTDDDVALFADSPILALPDGDPHRALAGLPDSAGDLPSFSGQVGTRHLEGRILALGEAKASGGWYAASDQMHNKFAVVDGEWIFTGSWNFTVTGLYGGAEDYLACRLDGSQQHAVELRSREVAAAYRAEFEEMWGSAGRTPDPAAANFHGRKPGNAPRHFEVGGRGVEVRFSPGDGAVERLAALVREGADHGVIFSIFAFSSQELADELKAKWEGSRDSARGERTGFALRGLFDATYWDQWWSASREMTGRVHPVSSANNPAVPWRNPAPVCRQGPDSRKLHSKSMIIDADTDSDPVAVIGSTNWSVNGEDVNDENMLIIHDRNIANQLRQEFEARWESSGCGG